MRCEFRVNRLSALFSAEENMLKCLSGIITHMYATDALDLKSVADMPMICTSNFITDLRFMFTILVDGFSSMKSVHVENKSAHEAQRSSRSDDFERVDRQMHITS